MPPRARKTATTPRQREHAPLTQSQEAGWDLPRQYSSLARQEGILDRIAETFQELDPYAGIAVNGTDGFRRRTETIDRKPKMDDPIIDPPAGIPMLWNAEAIQQSITEHYIGNFATSGYLVEAMLSDARISHAVNSRTKGVLKKKAYYTPNKRARDKKLAKYIADEMQEMHDDIFPQDILEQLWAFTPMMGWSLFNMVWEVQEEMTLPTFRFWHPAFTFFLMSGNLDERKLQAITMGGGSVNRTGANIPIICGDPEWFHFAPYGEYRGWIRGAVRQVGIPWLVRNLSLRDWSRLSEVHGIPQRIVKVPANALEEDKARIFQKLIRLASEAVFVLPVAEDGTGFGVELLEPKTADSYKVMEMLGHRCDSDIMLALKGTQLMSGLGDQKGGSSSMAASKTVKSEDEDYSVGDAVKITQALRKQVFPFIVNYNYEDAQDCIPQLLLSDEPPQDKSMNAKTWLDVSQAMLNFQELGAEVDLDEVKEEFEIPFKSNKLNPPEQPEPNVPGAEPSEEEVVQRLTELKMEQEQVESEELRKTMTLQTVLISKDDYSLDEAKKWLTDHEYKTDVDEKEDTLRFRQRDPGDFIPASFRTVNIEKGISFVLGKLKPSNEESHSAHGRRRAKHSDHQQWVDKLVESSMGHGVTAMTPHLKKLKKAIEEANSYDDLRRSLKRIAREVQRGSLEKLITNSRLMSHVAGRAAQQDDGE